MIAAINYCLKEDLQHILEICYLLLFGKRKRHFGEEQHPSTKPSTIICFKCLRWALPKIGLKVVIYCQN